MRIRPSYAIEEELFRNRVCHHCSIVYQSSIYWTKFCRPECKRAHHNMKRFDHIKKFIEYKIPTDPYWLFHAKNKIGDYLKDNEKSLKDLTDKVIFELLKEVSEFYTISQNSEERRKAIELIMRTTFTYRNLNF